MSSAGAWVLLQVPAGCWQKSVPVVVRLNSLAGRLGVALRVWMKSPLTAQQLLVKASRGVFVTHHTMEHSLIVAWPFRHIHGTLRTQGQRIVQGMYTKGRGCWGHL